MIGEELVPSDITGMGVLFHEPPLFPREELSVGLAFDVGPRSPAAEAKGAGVARIVQGLHGKLIGQAPPEDFPVAALGELQVLLPETLHGLPGRAGAGKGGKQGAQALLHLLVGIEFNLIVVVVSEPDGQRYLQVAALRLVEDAAD